MSTPARSNDTGWTRERLRALDRLVIEEYGIPGIVLMEHAGRSVAQALLADDAHDAGQDTERSESPVARACAVFCGGGNNGGDGFVTARWLDDARVRVTCWCTARADDMHGDARIAREACVRAGVAVRDVGAPAQFERARAELLAAPPRLLVDALLGTGFESARSTAAVRADVARVIELVNDLGARTGARTWAVDLPSGLDCDTGIAARPTVRADVTATLVGRKCGFDSASARAVLGRVIVLPIGAPRAALERVRASADLTPG